MARLGMDVDVVERQGRALLREGERITALAQEIDRAVKSLRGTWLGRSSMRFTDQEWPASMARLRHAAEAVSGLGQSALNNATEQRRTSAATNASAGAAGGTGGSVGSGGSSGSAVRPSHLRGLVKTFEGGPVPPGFETVESDELTRLGIDPARLHTASGLDATLFTDADGHYVLAFDGSRELIDWGQDAVGADGISDQQFEAVMLARDLQAAMKPNDELTFTGHSLGGGLASLASLTTGNKAVTFNAAGVSTPAVLFAVDPGGSSSIQEQAGMVAEIYANRIPVVGAALQHIRDDMFKDMLSPGQITAYYNPTDPLSLLQDGALAESIAVNPQSALGERVLWSDDSNPFGYYGINPGEYHSIDRFQSMPDN